MINECCKSCGASEEAFANGVCNHCGGKRNEPETEPVRAIRSFMLFGSEVIEGQELLLSPRMYRELIAERAVVPVNESEKK